MFPPPDVLIVTCEHGGNRVPPAYRAVLAEAGSALAGHRGWDIGSLELARHAARRCRARLFHSTTTRLLVDLNRSAGHRAQFSAWTRGLDVELRAEIARRYWEPYRQEVESHIADHVGQGAAVLHVSVHTFTPVLGTHVRRADVGLLYDPRRNWERQIAAQWRRVLIGRHDGLVVRRNYPYHGATDGFTTALRRRFRPREYAGLELEVNQRFPLGCPADWRRLRATVCDALAAVAAPSRYTE